MPSIVLTANATVNDALVWDNTPALLVDDGILATSPASGGVSTVFVNDFTSALPTDIQILGMVVHVKTKITGVASGTPTLNFFFTIDSETVSGSIKTLTGMTTGLASYTVGSSGDLWGFNWKRSHIHGNSDFGIGIYRSGDVIVDHNIDVVYLEIYYSYSDWLTGERSRYPYDYDVIKSPSNSDPTNGGNIPRQENGSGPEHMIKSEDVNLLGDCLYSIQAAIIDENNNNGIVRAIGFPPAGLAMTAITATITGTVASPGTVNFHLTQTVELLPSPTITNEKTTNLSAITKSETLAPAQPNGLTTTYLSFPFVSAIGWIVKTGSGTVLSRTEPVFVSPRLMAFRNRYGRTYQTIIGFTAMGKGIASPNYLGPTNNYYGSFSTPAPIPAGTLIVKLFGLSSPHSPLYG